MEERLPRLALYLHALAVIYTFTVCVSMSHPWGHRVGTSNHIQASSRRHISYWKLQDASSCRAIQPLFRRCLALAHKLGTARDQHMFLCTALAACGFKRIHAPRRVLRRVNQRH